MKTLAKLLYVEADEEITDLVDRLRDLSLEDEVTFVVPERARALQSAMSFRLLKRYADSYGKRVNVVSRDPRLQSMSLEAGFAAYPSLAAYDSGTEVHQPELGDQPDPAPAPAAVATMAPPRQTQVISAAPKKAPSRPNPPKTTPPLNSYRPYLIGAGVLALIALVVGLLYLPTATVTLFVQGTAIKEDVTLLGAPGTAAGSTDHFATQAVHASESQTLPGTATGQKQVLAQPSTGQVVFTESCIFLCDSGTTTIPTGTTVSTSDGKHYTTTKSASVASPRGSATVPVKAVTAGPDGNTAAHTITTIDRNRDYNLTVDNPQATSGGAEPRTATVILQSDIDSIKDAYAKEAVPRVTDQLNGKAAGLKVVPVGGGVQPTITVDRKVGDEVAGFGVTVKVAGDGVAFDEKTVNSMLKAALQRKLQQGQQLTNTLTSKYEPIDANPDGHITLNGHVEGFYTPVIRQDQVRSHLKGSNLSSARAYLLSQPHAVSARVTQQPYALPWLPLFSSRITVKVQEVTGGP
jgi:baseplate J-like protein